MTFNYENKKLKQGFVTIGCDEVGRGSLAGPVVAAAVALPKIGSGLKVYKDIKDSKLLTPQKRKELSAAIKECAVWSIAEVSQKAIDEINIHNATLLAMRKAVQDLFRHCEEFATKRSQGKVKIASLPLVARNDVCVLIDGRFTIPNFHMKQEAIVGGDNKVLSIAAASIIAKVYRDELMGKQDEKFPNYNFFRHKGYGTLHHRSMILKYGLSPLHRVSFCTKLI